MGQLMLVLMVLVKQILINAVQELNLSGGRWLIAAVCTIDRAVVYQVGRVVLLLLDEQLDLRLLGGRAGASR